MIKKRYLMVLSVAVVCVLLGSLLYNSITLADKPNEPKQVEVTNFPLDEQGNLKVSTPPQRNSLTLAVIPNSSFTDAFSGFTYFESTGTQLGYNLTLNVDGWKKAVLHLYWFNPDYPSDTSTRAYIWFWFRMEGMPLKFGVSTIGINLPEGSSTSLLTSGTLEINAPLLDILLYVRIGHPPTNARIALYLYLTR